MGRLASGLRGDVPDEGLLRVRRQLSQETLAGAGSVEGATQLRRGL